MPDVIEADLTWTATGFETGVQVEITADGSIGAVGRLHAAPTRRLAGRALLPGMVNAHSHAFQRGLRGRGETFPQGSGTFWTWREAMYRLVGELDEDLFYRLCLGAFHEMLACGITTVGEFHYLHHSPGDRDFAYDRLILRAARDAGIRLVLLSAYYRTGGIGQPLGSAQRRFDAGSLAEYWDNLDRLEGDLDADTQSLGVVAHSIRAAALEEIGQLHTEATRRGLVFHLHVEEQRREIEECVAAYGHPPMRLLADLLDGMGNVTAVHCTHTDPADVRRFLDAGGTVCICPTTEANLGDGIPGLITVTEAMRRGQLCLGSDSNARISPTEEMRWLEYGQRLAHERRGVLRNERGVVAEPLFEAATTRGAASLGIAAGVIRTGAKADFFTLDLDSPQLAGWTEDTLLAGFVTGTDAAAVGEVCVGGCWVDGGSGPVN